MSLGSHTITLVLEDINGVIAADSIEITVIDNPFEVPLESNQLTITPAGINLDVTEGITTSSVQINSLLPNETIIWDSVISESWLQLNPISGTTPSNVIVTIGEMANITGVHNATITIRSNSVEISDQLIQIQIKGEDENPLSGQSERTLFLPVIAR